MEEWKVCEEHTNYSVSNLGNVKNDKTGRGKGIQRFYFVS
jgi:hypothetical protein